MNKKIRIAIKLSGPSPYKDALLPEYKSPIQRYDGLTPVLWEIYIPGKTTFIVKQELVFYLVEKFYHYFLVIQLNTDFGLSRIIWNT